MVGLHQVGPVRIREQVHSAKEALARRLAEAVSEKTAVMAAGEVLLAELEQIAVERDDAMRRLKGTVVAPAPSTPPLFVIPPAVLYRFRS